MENTIYSDSLVKITNNYILLRKYYFPTFTSKRIEFSDIDFVEVVKPGLFTGKYRIWGTGDFKHWFPLDVHRTKKDVNRIYGGRFQSGKIDFRRKEFIENLKTKSRT